MLLSSFVLMLVGFYILLKADSVKSLRMFSLLLWLGFLYVALTIPVAMGFIWPLMLINVMGLVVSLVQMVVFYIVGNTKQSLLWFVILIMFGAATVGYIYLY